MSDYESVEEIKLKMEAESKDNVSDNKEENKQLDSSEELDTPQTEETSESKKPLTLAERMDNAYKNLSSTEKEAWSQGWRPKEFFKGKNRDGTEKEFTEAEDFLKKSKDALPVANDRIKKMAEELEEAKKIAKEAKERIEKAEKRGYEKALQELTKKQREAVELGDLEEFDKLKEQELELAKDLFPSTATDKDIPQQAESVVADVMTNQPQRVELSEADQVLLRDWQARNSWFNLDPKLAAYAIKSEEQLINEKPYLSFSERLQIVEQEVKDIFYNKFTPQKNDMFDSGNNNTGFGETTKKAKGYSDLSAADKKNCENLIKIRGIDESKQNEFRQKYAKAVYQ